MATKRVAVVGGGVIGVGSALKLKMSLPQLEVTLISEKFSPNTTGDGSAGLLMPYSLGPDSDVVLIGRWFQETFKFLQEIILSAEAGKLGVGFLQVFWISGKKDIEFASYGESLLNCEPMNDKQLSLFPSDFKFGYTGTTIFAECKRLLPGLMKRFEDLGGKIETRKIASLDELDGSFDVVVNCPGIGAATLVPDSTVYPVRGQIIKVKAPWIKHSVMSDDYYIIPNSDFVVLGGTKQKNNWNTAVDAKDRENIWNECCRLIPSLKNAQVLDEFVGLRPTRSCPRVELDTKVYGSNGLQVIHNYGHGGGGVSLFWGCANEVLTLLHKIMSK